MTAEEFFAFTQTRPDDERWELIDGDPLMNATASRHHQRIVMNISGMLDRIMIEKQPWWEALPGIGVRLSINSVPVPDILIRPSDDLIGVECEDVIVAFEVLSPSSKSMDLRWKHRAYATLPTLQHYVVVAQDALEIVCFDRATGFVERRVEGASGIIELPTVGRALPLTGIYRGTGLL
jgi:Uma2 family endonuclease